MLLSAVTALLGAVLGGAARLCSCVAAPPSSLLRAVVTSLCGVLAQFGGVALAFAFIATIGFTGVLTAWLQRLSASTSPAPGWLYGLPGPDRWSTPTSRSR